MVKPRQDNQENVAQDRLFQSILKDFLNNKQPPSLRSKIFAEILSRSEHEHTHLDPHLDPQLDSKPGSGSTSRGIKMSAAELDEALGAAQADVDYATDNLASKSKLNLRTKSKPIRLEPYLWEYRSFRRGLSLAALAASLLALASASRFWYQNREQGQNLADNKPSESIIASESPEERQDLAEADPTPQDNTTKERIENNDQPSQVPEKVLLDPIQPRRLVFAQPVALPQPEFDQVLNSQIRLVWEKHQVNPKLTSDEELWLDRVSQSIVGRMPTTDEREAFRRNKSDDRRVEVVQSLLKSDEFSLHWSRLLVEHLRGQPVPKSPRGDLSKFVDWIRKGLDNGTPIGILERILIDDEQISSDASYWLTETEKMVDLASREMLAQSNLADLQQGQNSSHIGLADSLLHKSGHGVVACLQCHPMDSKALTSIDETNKLKGMDFWSFPAALKQLSMKRKNPQALASKSEQEFFYETSDGKLILANPSFAGSNGESATLQDWIEQSPKARLGLVESVWTKVLQQPLVPSFGLSDAEGKVERMDLKELLANQLQATGDLRSLIRAIVVSDAFLVPDASLSKNWYLKANDRTIARYHHDSRLFGFVPGTVTRGQSQKWRSTNQIAKWMEVSKERDNNLSALAQADNVFSPTIKPRKDTELDEGEQVRFLLSALRPYMGLEILASNLSTSNLTWNDQVNHMHLFLNGRYPTQTERIESNGFLELARQNHQQALVLMATSQLGSF